MAGRVEFIKKVSGRLFIVLVVLLTAALVALIFASEVIRVTLVVILTGTIGGFVGLQRRVKGFEDDDLELLASSWLYTVLAPVVGGVLALLLYILFLSELLAGDLFPSFVPNADVKGEGINIILEQHAEGYQDYAKLLVWAFIGGFSEKFVVDVIGRFEASAKQGG